MYQLLCGQQSITKCKKVLHIVETKELTSELVTYINSIPCESKQILKLGETYLQPAGFRQFNTVMMHNSATPKEQWKQVLKFKYDELILEVLRAKNRMYIGIDSGGAMLQKQFTLVGYDSTNGNDIATPLLGVLNHRIVMNWDITIPNVSVLRQIFMLSMKGDIYLFPKGTGYTSHNKTFNGMVYVARMGAMYSCVSTANGKRTLTKLPLK